MNTTTPITEPVPAFVLWHRTTGRHKWRVIGARPTGAEALKLMDGIKAGDWMLIDDGRDPNTKPNEVKQ